MPVGFRGRGSSRSTSRSAPGKPVTRIELTLAGREALEAHARHLLAVLQPRFEGQPADEVAVPTASADAADEWVD
jgi:hypothetical protein